MPTILLVNGLRFFFFSNENNEPIHIHVTKGNANGKIWLHPTVKIAYMYKFSNSEENEIMQIAAVNQEQFKKKWNEHFNK